VLHKQEVVDGDDSFFRMDNLPRKSHMINMIHSEYVWVARLKQSILSTSVKAHTQRSGMEASHNVLRRRIIKAMVDGLQPLAYVLAGWEGGSVAFGREDELSDIDLNFLLNDAGPTELFYAAVESALKTLSPIVAMHPQPPGRYFKLRDSDDFLLVDVCIFRPEDLTECLDAERHGKARPLFDKGAWLQRELSNNASTAANRARRLEAHKAWFSISQGFVRKAILRDQHVEALASYWGYTLKPLVELLRMKYCPPRWDFGMRYLERDLPAPIYSELRRLLFVADPEDLAGHLAEATAWAERLLGELDGSA
jgi:hypothetical protein